MKLDGVLFTTDSPSSRQRVRAVVLRQHLIPYECGNDGCAVTTTWLDKPLTLDLDHKNGIRNDNRIENLRFLCPNCHSQEFTSNRKKGHSRYRPIISENTVLTAALGSTSIRQILIKLNVADASSNYAKVKAVLEKHGKMFAHYSDMKIKKGRTPFSYLSRRKRWPSKDRLAELLWKKPSTEIAKDYGVVNSMVNKWCAAYKLDKPSRGYWAKVYAGKRP